MSTETKTETKKETVVKTSAKVVEAIKTQLVAEATAYGKQAFTGKTIREEAKRMGYDEKQARQMATLCWREAKGFKGTEEETSSFDLRARPDVSKAMSIAFPVQTHAKDVDKAIMHNEKIGSKHGRISSSKVLDIARGKLTFAEALAGKSAQGGKTPEPKKVEKLTAETLENELAAIRARYVKPKMFTPEQARDIADRVFCDGTYSPEKK